MREPHQASPGDRAHCSVEELARRAQGGDRASFDALVKRLEPKLRAHLRGRVGDDDDADDLAQETFIKALDNLSRYDPKYQFSTWLFTIANNLTTSHFRKARPMSRDVELGSTSGDAETLAERDAGALLWRRASELLKPAQYNVLWLRYGEDMTVGEIAETTGRRVVAIRVSLYRARRRLAGALKELAN